MESLTFTMLATQFGKNEDRLRNAGFQFNYESNENLYHDVISLTGHDNFKNYYFVIQHRKWDLYKEFSLQSTNSERFYFRLNPTDGNPIRMNYNNSSWFGSSLFPNDLERFGDEILRILQDLSNKIQQDQLAIVSSENTIV